MSEAERGDALLTALTRQADLVMEVRRLRVQSRTLAWLVVAIVAIVIALGLVAWRGREIARDAQSLAGDLELVVAAQEVERAQSALEACRIRNGANAVTREQFRHAYETIAGLDVNDVNLKQVTDRLIASIPTADSQDRDCDDNSRLDPDDYPG